MRHQAFSTIWPRRRTLFGSAGRESYCEDRHYDDRKKPQDFAKKLMRGTHYSSFYSVDYGCLEKWLLVKCRLMHSLLRLVCYQDSDGN